jgi:uncharacterized membrane protein
VTERSGTGRLEAFSDGVFAIAATLLVLEFAVTQGPHAPSLGYQLVHQLWTSYLAYITSFLTIGIIWINHHSVMQTIGRADRTFLFINTLLLLVVSFIPFPTRLVAAYLQDPGNERAAVFAYDVTLLLMAISFNVLWTYARRNRRLIGEDVPESTIRAITWAFRPGVPLYVLVLVVAIWSPLTSVVLTLVLAAFYLPSAALFEPLIARSSASPGTTPETDGRA